MKKLKFLTIVIIGLLCAVIHLDNQRSEKDTIALIESAESMGISRNAACIQMFESIERWSEFYNIPKQYAYGIAYEETRYGGPFDWAYEPKRVSPVGAVGPMQIMPATGKGLDPNSNRDKLLTDIDYNVELSMKLLRKLHDRYGDWATVFGCYNTGRPMINQYARNVVTHKINWSL